MDWDLVARARYLAGQGYVTNIDPDALDGPAVVTVYHALPGRAGDDQPQAGLAVSDSHGVAGETDDSDSGCPNIKTSIPISRGVTGRVRSWSSRLRVTVSSCGRGRPAR